MIEIKNKTMKKLFLLATTAIFFAVNSNAQVSRETKPNQKVHSDSMRAHNKAMMDELNLTADQKSQMKTIQENTKQQREAIQNDASLTQDEKRTKMKDLQKSHSQKVNSILTPDQQAKRSAYIKNMKEQRKEHHKKSGATTSSVSE
jgi:Spy/CpxP family protein refolding chaperone